MPATGSLRTVRFQPTIRLRLTLVYGAMFLAAGAVVLSLNYALVQRSLNRQASSGVDLEAGLGSLGRTLDGTWAVPDPSEILTDDGRRLDDVLARIEANIRDNALRQLLVQSAVALGVMALVSVGAGWALAGRVLRPIQAMTAAARRLSEANLHERLDLAGPADELRELADTFDAMLDRLESAFEGQRRFVANASHELRTPLAIQRTLVDVALADPAVTADDLREMAVGVREAVDRSEHLIEGLLVLARSHQGLGPVEALDLAAAARSALDQAAVEAEAGDVAVRFNFQPVVVTGNRVLLERLVANLVQNAVRHNRRGGWLEVSTSATSHTATLAIRNSGAPVAAEQVPALFEPFRRLRPDRVEAGRGAGLGLSIVQAVAGAHRGSVQVEPLAGGGLAVTVSLPGVHPGAGSPTGRP